MAYRWGLRRLRRYNLERDLPQERDRDVLEQGYVPEEAEFAPAAPRPRDPLALIPDVGAGAEVLFFYVILWAASAWAWHSEPFRELMWVSYASVHDGQQWWRLFTALLIHSDWGHLLANSPLFLIFGWYLASFYRFWVFPVAVVLIGAAANWLTVLNYEPSLRLLGASGMVYGMVGLWLVLYVFKATTYSLWMRLFRAMAFALAVMFPTTFHQEVSYLAHLFGFVLGLGFGLAIGPFVTLKQPHSP